MYQKKFEELELRDDFIFGKVMRNKEICKKTLEILLGIQIEDIEYPETQKAINITYQGMIDLNLIEKGLPYTALNTSYVIFICTFDPFGKGNYQYTFRALCQEDTAFALEDGATRIFFNTKGNLEEAPEELRKLLHYLETSQPESMFTKQLDHEVKRAKQNEKWRREYMKELLHDFDMKEECRREGREEGKEEGRKEGREEGKQKVNLLNQLLAEQNRMEDIILSAQDTEYQKKLFEEFQI